MTEFDISSIDNEQVDAKKKKAKTGKSSKSLKKNQITNPIQTCNVFAKVLAKAV